MNTLYLIHFLFRSHLSPITIIFSSSSFSISFYHTLFISIIIYSFLSFSLSFYHILFFSLLSYLSFYHSRHNLIIFRCGNIFIPGLFSHSLTHNICPIFRPSNAIILYLFCDFAKLDVFLRFLHL